MIPTVWLIDDPLNENEEVPHVIPKYRQELIFERGDCTEDMVEGYTSALAIEVKTPSKAVTNPSAVEKS